MSSLRELLAAAVAQGAADVHLKHGQPPIFRVNNELVTQRYQTLTAASLEGRLRSRLGARVAWRNLPNILLGGGIGGTCTKQGPAPAPPPADLADLLVCPDCRERTGAYVALRVIADGLQCTACGAAFPRVEGVQFLLPTALFRQLYPDVDRRC